MWKTLKKKISNPHPHITNEREKLIESELKILLRDLRWRADLRKFPPRSTLEHHQHPRARRSVACKAVVVVWFNGK